MIVKLCACASARGFAVSFAALNALTTEDVIKYGQHPFLVDVGLIEARWTL